MLGELLKDLRNIYHIMPEVLVDGLCTVKMLKKYESGERQPEKLLGDALWQRMGRSMDKFEVNLDHDEYILAEKRAHIQEWIRQGRLAEAEQALSDYEKIAGTDQKPLHKQFACLQRAELFRRRRISADQQEKTILEGLAQTIPEPIVSPRIMERRRFSVMELLLLERYAILIEGQVPETALGWYRAIQVYLEQTAGQGIDCDLADKYRLLPPILYRLAIRAFKAELYDQALQYLEDGCVMLGKRHSLSALFVLMEELKFEILQKTGREAPIWEQECLRLMKEAIGEHQAEWMENTYPDYTESALRSINATLRERRLVHGLSEEDLAEGICDVRTLKTAESGKRMLQAAKKNALFKKLGLSTRKFDGTIITRRYSDFRDDAKMAGCDYQGDANRAEQLYRRLAGGLKRDEVTNHQFICYWDICLKYSRNQLAKPEYQDELWKLLRETLPDAGGTEGCCIFTRYEGWIIENLAWTANGAETGQIEKLLEAQYRRFAETKTLVRFFPGYYTALSYCLGRIAKQRNDFGKAESYLDTVLGQMHYLKDDLRWGNLLFQRFQLEEEKQTAQGNSLAPGNEIDFRWIRYAYAIKKLYFKDIVGTEFIENYLDKRYGNKETILDHLMGESPNPAL